MNPHILVFNQYFPPDTASTGRYVSDVCEHFAQQGARVTVITATPCYAPGAHRAPLVEHRNNLHIHRIPMGALSGRNPLSKRVAGYAYFLLRAQRLAQSLARYSPPDAVLCFHNPPFLPAVALPIARHANAPFLYSPQDIYPEVLTLSGRFTLPKTLRTRWRQWHLRILESSDRIIVLSEDMQKTISSTGIPQEKITVIPPWCSLAPIEPEKRLQSRQHLGVRHSLLAVFAGNIGSLQPLNTLLQTAHDLKKKDILFFIVGDGIRKPQSKCLKELQNIWNVHFLPFQHRQDYEYVLASADLGVICLTEGAEQVSLPSRVTSYLASGLPILAFMSPQCELANILKDSQCGWVCETAREAVNLLTHLQSQKGELLLRSTRALQTAQKLFSHEKNLALYWNVLLQTLRTHPPGTALQEKPYEAVSSLTTESES